MNAFIFDLDGVIVDTAKYHFIAWKTIAETFNFNLSESQNENLKGVSRSDSLDLLIQWGKKDLIQEKKDMLLNQKNKHYLQLIQEMGSEEILPGVLNILDFTKNNNVPVALGLLVKMPS